MTTRGWHSDPYGTHAFRFHDGTDWTKKTKDEEDAETLGGTSRLASIGQKRSILDDLRRLGKYERPFATGHLPNVSVLGGDWNDYAQVVLAMMLNDTLLSIEERLMRLEERLNDNSPGEP